MIISTDKFLLRMGEVATWELSHWKRAERKEKVFRNNFSNIFLPVFCPVFLMTFLPVLSPCSSIAYEQLG